MSGFDAAKVLVTGGTGSIGGAIVDALLAYEPAVVRVISRDDTKQFELAQRHRGERRLRLLIGDVRSRERLARAMSGIDLVFHAAALKHIAAAEFNPFEATETNVRGTQNAVEAAIDADVGKFLTISTDKAVDPTNVMGATKLLAERLMSAAEHYKGAARTQFAAVRFGNVIGSRGSIAPLIWHQVSRGGPVTVTNPDMTRYMMPISDAVQLCFAAMSHMEGGEVFILKMPRVRIGDLIEVLIEMYAPQFGYNPREIRVEVIGMQAGEKRDEALMTADEAAAAVELDRMYVVRSRSAQPETKPLITGLGNEPLLARSEIKDLIDSAGWLRPETVPPRG